VPTTVTLQNTMSYGLIPLWILFLMLISPLLIKLKNKKKKKTEVKQEKKKTELKPVPRPVKESYVNELHRLFNDYSKGRRDSRDCYQLLSVYIREFVNEYAGVDVTNKTLAEIRGVKIPKLEKLIEEYYACEFAPDVTGNIENAILRTIQTIKEW